MLLSWVEIDHISLCILIAIHYTIFSVKGECSDWSNVDALVSFLSLQLQPNPVLTIPESLLQEEEEPMATIGAGGEEEEGMISDPGTEIMSVQDEKVKVRTQ